MDRFLALFQLLLYLPFELNFLFLLLLPRSPLLLRTSSLPYPAKFPLPMYPTLTTSSSTSILALRELAHSVESSSFVPPPPPRSTPPAILSNPSTSLLNRTIPNIPPPSSPLPSRKPLTSSSSLLPPSRTASFELEVSHPLPPLLNTFSASHGSRTASTRRPGSRRSDTSTTLWLR